MPRPLRRLVLTVLALVIASAAWLPVLHVFYTEDVAPYFDESAVPPRVRKLAARHVRLWEDPQRRRRELARMRRSNAEWDFMGRTFLVLALANLSLREPDSKPRYLAIIDRIIDDTISVEKSLGKYHFLMGYATQGSFVQRPPRSLFVDGEIAMMIGARRLVEDLPRYRDPFARRISLMTRRLAEAPVHCCESYPDECWMFCNAAAMVAIRMADVLDGTDHDTFLATWLTTIREKLTHQSTGLLVSAFTYDGEPTHGPEGSSIWFVIHCLQALDPVFAQDQYDRAKHEIGRTILGFGFAAEWPDSWVGPRDIDSGAVIPMLDVSAGASGMAFLAASGFRDAKYLQSLLATIDFAAMPEEVDGQLRYCASNQVGDAVLLYSLAQGPLWRKIGRQP